MFVCVLSSRGIDSDRELIGRSLIRDHDEHGVLRRSPDEAHVDAIGRASSKLPRWLLSMRAGHGCEARTHVIT